MFCLKKGKEEALEAVALMYNGAVIDLTRDMALEAAVISVEFKLPMADSIMLACSRATNATLWTQDEHFRGIRGVMYIEKKY